MAKKRKQTKLSLHEQQKLDQAHRLKNYTQRLFNLLKELGLDEAIPHFSKSLILKLYYIRPVPVRIDMSEVDFLDNHDRKCIENDCHRILKATRTPFTNRNGETRQISIVDYYELWLPLLVTIVSEYNFGDDIAHCQAIHRVVGEYGLRATPDKDGIHRGGDDYNHLFDTVHDLYENIILSFSYQISNPCTHLLKVKRIGYDEFGGNARFAHVASFASMPVESIWGRDRKGERRKLYRLIIPIKYELYSLSRRIPNNPYIPMDPDRPYDIYIQSHAITRLFERLHGIPYAWLNICMQLSLLAWKVDWYKGSLLIEMNVEGVKLGYFFADFTKERRIVIRTFYFLTYDHTPEGEMLSSLAGLKAEDKKYLLIDKLGTFLASDIDRRSKLASLFREAGCAHLLELKKRGLFIDRTIEHKAISNEFTEKYLSIVDPL